MFLIPLVLALPIVPMSQPLIEQPVLPEARLSAALAPVVEPASSWTALQGVEGNGGGSYLRASAGFVTMQDADSPDQDIEFNEGYLLALAFGQRMNDNSDFNFDLELEAVWTDQDADDNGPIQAVRDVTFGALFLNGKFDVPLGERLSVYAGAGIGAAWVDVGTSSDAVNDFDSDEGPYLAWQLRAGLEWRFANSVAANVGYRFITNDDVELDDDIGGASFDLSTEQHVLELGLRFGL